MPRLLKIGYTTVADATAKGIIDDARPNTIALYHNFGEFFDDVLYFVPFGKADKGHALSPTVRYEEVSFVPHGNRYLAALAHLWRMRRRVNDIVTALRPDVVQICGPHIPALLAVLSPAIRRRPTVCFIEAYWEDIVGQQAYFPAPVRRLLPLWYRLVYRLFDVYTGAPSLAPAYYARRGMARERIGAWVQEIDLRIIDAVPVSEAPDALALLVRPLICVVGRLHPEKLADEALDVFRRAVEAGCQGTLVVVGDGEQRAQLEAYVSRHGLAGRVLFVGQLPSRQVIAVMKACDLMIAPMQGTALVEAMASGLAIVAYDHETHRAHLRDGINGRLVPHHDIAAASAALQELINNAELRARLGRAAHDEIHEKFGFDKMFAIMNDGFRRAMAAAS